MQDNPDFPARYKKLVDGNFTPDPAQDEEMRKTIMLLMFSRDPSAAGRESDDCGAACPNKSP